MTNKRILIVDDEEYIREVTQISLETVAAWTVITAGSGKEGLILADLEQPDAILLDMMMPALDGIATFEILKANPSTKDIPVILLTANLPASDRRRYVEIGFTAAIAKPFIPLQLASQVAEALGWT